MRCCISFDSYIKPQLSYHLMYLDSVVYLLTPTSNHNFFRYSFGIKVLYIFWLLHQTTTSLLLWPLPWGCISFDSYIKPQLSSPLPGVHEGCISFDSYIKPQRGVSARVVWCVVYLLTPTSNHNCWKPGWSIAALYIFWLLHQTTTFFCSHSSLLSCISFDSYIKPQHGGSRDGGDSVVYLLTPTSNHNRYLRRSTMGLVVYLLTPTSNHNDETAPSRRKSVVYLLTPTSNHNLVPWQVDKP